MATRTILEGHSEPNYPEQVMKLVLKSLGVDNDDANAIAFKVLEPLPWLTDKTMGTQIDPSIF